MKNPLILAGIEPATFRFVAQHLNHCATAVAVLPFLYFSSRTRQAPRKFPDNADCLQSIPE